MKGKFVNICMAFLNILVGALIIIYSWRVPSEITELTVQEYQIIQIAKILIYVLFGIVSFLNIVHFFLDMRNGSRKTGYLIATCAVSFIFVQIWQIAIFSILGALIILISSIKFRWIETNSYTMISIIIILMVLACLIIGISLIYENLGIYIRDKENEGEIAYTDTFFRYITELEEDTDVYINVKSGDKYGYINSDGELVIDFIYDYASPFVPISVYDKHFDIALVCQDGRTIIILKNQREVMSYRSESMDTNYEAKIAELEDIYYNVLDQTDEFKFEIDTTANSSITKIAKYDETSESYTYRYDLNDEYDLIITQSSMGLGDTYELAYKNDLSIRINLDCENLDYDENYLYIFSNGTIPFYDISENKQGWFTGYGRKVTLSGNAQILDFFGENTLIKNHNDDTIYFIDSNGEIVSDIYKEIYIINNDRFIVKNENNKYIVINSSFEKVFEGEWDFADTSLISYELYIFGTTDGVIDFNEFDYSENMNLQILNENGEVLVANINQIYSTFYKISNDDSISYSERYSTFLNNLKSMDSAFVGDKFYE